MMYIHLLIRDYRHKEMYTMTAPVVGERSFAALSTVLSGKWRSVAAAISRTRHFVRLFEKRVRFLCEILTRRCQGETSLSIPELVARDVIDNGRIFAVW